MTDEHLRRIGEKDEAMRKAYDRVPDAFPETSQSSGKQVIDKDMAFRKRLLYRSKQRGWLEVDLLMGTWADKFLPGMKEEDLHEYERILNAETIDLYNIVTGKQEAPAELDGPIMREIVKWAKNSPLGKADPAAYAAVKHIFSN
jgi:succinate dehydrogenase assembly factor 2